MLKYIHYACILNEVQGYNNNTKLQRRCRFTAQPGNVKFLHCLAVHSGLQGKETHKQQVSWEKKQNINVRRHSVLKPDT